MYSSKNTHNKAAPLPYDCYGRYLKPSEREQNQSVWTPQNINLLNQIAKKMDNLALDTKTILENVTEITQSK